METAIKLRLTFVVRLQILLKALLVNLKFRRKTFWSAAVLPPLLRCQPQVQKSTHLQVSCRLGRKSGGRSRLRLKKSAALHNSPPNSPLLHHTSYNPTTPNG